MPFHDGTARREGEITQNVLHLAIGLARCRDWGLERHDSATAVPTLFPAPDATVAQRFGMRCEEMTATAFRTLDAAWRLVSGEMFHRRRLRCISAKLTLWRETETAACVPSSTAP